MLLTDFKVNHIAIQISLTLLKPIKKKNLHSYAFTFQWESFNDKNIYTRSLLDRILSLKICNFYSECFITFVFQVFDTKTQISFSSKGIKKNKTLQHLSLEFCQIGDSGVESE